MKTTMSPIDYYASTLYISKFAWFLLGRSDGPVESTLIFFLQHNAQSFVFSIQCVFMFVTHIVRTL